MKATRRIAGSDDNRGRTAKMLRESSPVAPRPVARLFGTATSCAVRGVLAFLACALLCCVQARADDPVPDPKDLAALATILNKPEVRAWIERGAEVAGSQPGSRPAVATAVQQTTGLSKMSGMAATSWLQSLRVSLFDLANTVPSIPDELRRAFGVFAGELRGWLPLNILLLIAGFIGAGLGLQRLLWWRTAKLLQRMIRLPNVSATDRMRLAGSRFAYGMVLLAAFAAGSIGSFLLFSWPPILGRFMLGLLQVGLIVRLMIGLGRVILAPGAAQFRLAPMATPTAQFWFDWIAILVGYFFFMNFILSFLSSLGVSGMAVNVIGIGLSLPLLAMTIFVAWRRPDRETGVMPERGSRLGTWLLTFYLIGLWLVLFTGAETVFYLGVVLLLLPIVIGNAKRAMSHILADGTTGSSAPAAALIAVAFERGVRAVILLGSLYVVLRILGLDLGDMDRGASSYAWVLRSLLDLAAVVLVIDLVWQLAKVWIDSRIRSSDDRDEHTHDRWRTLLPVLRNILFFVLVALGLLTVLASLGVEIAPLLASAGIVGIAVGFGAQTLVKDIISGLFFLVDDAFRVGEYIESGSIKGTVEAFSLRSMKLRHHRGALHTIPFGSLDKITNYSRDWVIDKFQFGVTYDTDLDKVKKLIKQIGKELAEEPEFAPHVIEPLKMQGVETFGDYAIQIRMKMKTKPGEQFMIRRLALAMIKKRFAENGISFATPTVSVAGGGANAQAAVAQRGLELVRPAEALPAQAGGDVR